MDLHWTHASSFADIGQRESGGRSRPSCTCCSHQDPHLLNSKSIQVLSPNCPDLLKLSMTCLCHHFPYPRAAYVGHWFLHKKKLLFGPAAQERMKMADFLHHLCNICCRTSRIIPGHKKGAENIALLYIIYYIAFIKTHGEVIFWILYTLVTNSHKWYCGIGKYVENGQPDYQDQLPYEEFILGNY